MRTEKRLIPIKSDLATISSDVALAATNMGSLLNGAHMKVGLFIPCYIDAFFPAVGVATLELLERLGLDVVYPLDQTFAETFSAW